MGRRLLESDFPHKDLSLVAVAAALEVPLTVHVAVGTDIIHLHPSVAPEALGATTHRDFRLFAALVSELDRRGLYQPGLRGDHPGGLPEGPHPGPQPGP